MSSARTSALVALLVAVLGVGVFANGLSNGLTTEELTAVADDAAHDPRDVRTILGTPGWSAGGDVATYRPLATWTLAVGRAIHGEHPVGHHLVNVVLHAAAAALVVLLARELGASLAVAGLAGALFAVHPVHGDAVATIVGRSAVLATALALLALLWQRRATRGGGPAGYAAGAVVAYALALLANEQAAALLVLLPLVALGPGADAPPRRTRAALVTAALAAVTVGYLVLRHAAFSGAPEPAEVVLFPANPAAGATPAARVLTALAGLARAVRLLVVPYPLSPDYGYAHAPLVESALAPAAIAGIVAAVALIFVGVAVRRDRGALFWWAVAVLAWLPVSNLIFPIETVFRERLLYLPSAGFCVLAAIGLLGAPAAWRPATAGLAALVVLVWGIGTALRNPIWRDDASLAEAMVASAPDSAHAHAVLGSVYLGAGHDEDAARELAEALKINPKDTSALYNLGVIYQRHGQPIDALSVFRRVVDLQPDHYAAWVNFASVNNSQGMFTPGLEAAERAITIRPDVPNGHVVRGFALRGLMRLDEARDSFDQALRVTPGYPDALLGLGIVAMDRNDFTTAAATFDRLVAASPSADAYRALVYSYRTAGRESDAEKAAAAARERFPDDPFFAPDGDGNAAP